MPRFVLLTSAAFAALALCACDGKSGSRRESSHDRGAPLIAVTQLQCPDHQGPLTRVRTAPDGLSCDYAGPKGAEVTLKLVQAGDGGTQAVLAGLERELNALIPSVASKIAKANAEADRADAAARNADAEAGRADAASEALDRAAEKAEADAERAQALAEKARALADGDRAEAAAAQARADAVTARLAANDHARSRPGRSDRRGRDGDGENVHVALPGLRVNTQGDKADVRLPGISVKADGDNADVRLGPITIKADDASGNVNIDANDTQMSIRSQGDAAEIRTRHKGSGVRATYIVADDQPGPNGWRMAGYEARGPEGGPLVIAVVRSKEERNSDDDVFDSAKALVRKNAGG